MSEQDRTYRRGSGHKRYRIVVAGTHTIRKANRALRALRYLGLSPRIVGDPGFVRIDFRCLRCGMTASSVHAHDTLVGKFLNDVYAQTPVTSDLFSHTCPDGQEGNLRAERAEALPAEAIT